ncbi:MAG TPA: helix-turn-helix domain-containing protein [Ilumatobacteraceae bacterium]|nr:helix-turn-helix domain-containing protein [Ilumatobacteraceae bacterium]
MSKELSDLVDEVRLSFHAFSEFARWAHGHRIDPPGRAVLEYLSRNHPSTVPSMARSRGVTRQHIQTIVNDLESQGLVETSANPAHKRSPLSALTRDGRALIESIARKEEDLVEPLRGAIDPDRLTAAAATLAEVRKLLVELENES